MKHLAKIGFLSFLAFAFQSTHAQQCKGFTKRNCLPELAPYLSNGQMNSAHFVPGEKAQLELNFSQGISYRLLICADEYFEGLNYKLSDKTTDEIYYSDTLKDVFSLTDLKVKKSGPLKLEIDIPAKENATGIIRNGCVTILVGFKE